MSFLRLQKKIDEMRNPTVVGLDPDLAHIPPDIMERYIKEKGETLDAASLAVIEFNIKLITALCDIVPAVKVQAAFYEMLGATGMAALKVTCDYARSKGMYVIIDAKRGDIGSTAAAYSAAYLGTIRVGNTEFVPFYADALTVNAYLGSDGLRPFLDDAVRYDKALFALVKTSNPSSGEFQDRPVIVSAGGGSGDSGGGGGSGDSCDRGGSGNSGDRGGSGNCGNGGGSGEAGSIAPLYSVVGDLIESISLDTVNEYGYTRAGAVVGATYPEELVFLRERLRHTFFLVPGYGAQGGTAADVKAAFDAQGRGAVVNSSRGIIAAWKDAGSRKGKRGANYLVAARDAALKMRDELRGVL